MAKPAGSSCNLDCRYCFYLSKQTLRGGPGTGRMADRTLELFVRQYIEANTGPEVVFSWQGGEPTLLGLEFFQKVVELQRRYAKPGQRIENDLQTNGILLDAGWAEFLKEHRFLVGLSIDGPRELHDRYRVNKGGAPTFDKVMAAATVLRKAGVPFNTLTCVHRFNAERPLDVYRFLRRELDSTYIQFIPIVQARGFETDAPAVYDTGHMPIIGSARSKPGHPESIVTDWSVDPDRYGYFLSRVFDEWRRRDLGRVLVNHFETLVAQHLGLPAQICIYHQFCGKGVALEHDGGVYACDHYVYPQYLLGNLSETPLAEMVFSERQVAFGYAKSETLPDDCRACEYLRDCWGECPGNRLLRTPSGEPGLNYLCSGLKKFFKHARPAIDEIAAAIRKQNG
ncbi:anaerobic sulfatase maturase [Rhodopseudomonas palustris]|uniref:anaerobic sulfatase maturase n=1 Tax=Rhodopseudomonas palustris TaxID=1076 RepID=UPI000D1A97E8|nr:anaerobic sulfatase maturase [Rhodopseudomonas palustris]AVT80773.1 Putative arylsulfatase regulatory protein [Rhodopseudomonas palustris]